MSSSDLLNGTSSLIEYNKTDGTYYADPTNKINKVSSSGLSGGSSSSLTHDLNGNIIDDGRNVYTFDVENKLIEVKDKASGSVIANYYYDAEGRRIKSLHGSSGQSSFYIYSGDQIVEERDNAGSLLQWNIWGLGIDDLLVTNKDGIKYYPLTNDQGSVLALTDLAGNVLQRYDYDSFGNVTVLDSDGVPLASSPSPLASTLFQGREFDLETGLYYFRARYYSPELGRFISHDPIGYKDSMNLYQAFKNNPLKYVDPKGEYALVIGGVIALAATYFGYESTKPNSALKEVVGDAVSAVKEKANEIKNKVIAYSTIGAIATAVLTSDNTTNNDSSNVSGDKVAEDEVEDDNPEDTVKEPEQSDKNDGKENAQEGIYEFPDAREKGKTYVGQSGNIPNRLKQHERKGKKEKETEAETKEVKGGKTAREVAEQQRLNELGGPKNVDGSEASNKVNPIGKARQAQIEKEYGEFKPSIQRTDNSYNNTQNIIDETIEGDEVNNNE